MNDRSPYFSITHDAAPEGSTIQIEAYQFDDELAAHRCVLTKYRSDVGEGELIKTEFGLPKEELDNYMCGLKDVARDYSLSDFISGSDETYRVDLADDSIVTNLCRWDADSAPQDVEQIFYNLKNRALERTILGDEL